jgi:hypothetical protein
MSYPFIVQGNNITVVIGNKPHTISKSHITYNKVLEAIKAQDWDLVKNIIEPVKVVLNYGQGHVSVKGETLYWKGKEMHNALSTRMIAMLQDGFPIEPLVSFMENLMTNPSKRAVDELYGFLEKNNLPITPDGHFLAYKKIRRDYKDIHSGTMDNSVGKIVEMARNEVDDNKDQTCSTGLHFCSESYLQHFGGSDSRVVILKINPADVVSIPSDYNNSKGRACRYEVIGEIGNNPDDAVEFDKPVQTTANSIYVPEPKIGATEFYQGYSDGYYGNAYTGYGKKYAEGYDKGITAQRDGTPEMYRYEFLNEGDFELDVLFEDVSEAAPVAQEYDKYGNALSMTPNAIRKRKARAAKAAQAQRIVGGSWPQPKV